MNIYNVEETQIGNYFKINYILARQLMLIFDTYNQRILDATLEDLSNSILETVYHFENKVSYGYEYVPKGWNYYIQQAERHNSYKEFINWFLKNRQQPIDYLLYGALKSKFEKRKPIKSGADNTYTDTSYQSAEYGGVPISIEDTNGKVEANFARRF